MNRSKSLKILFVSTSIPFPSRQGVELPLEKLIEGFSRNHSVELLVLLGNRTELDDYNERIANLPKNVRSSYVIYKKSSKLIQVLKEIIGVSPSFSCMGYNKEEIRKLVSNWDYDAIWFSPIGTAGLLLYCKSNQVAVKPLTILGANDAATVLYWNRFVQVFKRLSLFEWNRILQGFRVPWIYYYERKLLKIFDVAHLQTVVEFKRVKAILGRDYKYPKLIYANNGKKTELESVQWSPGNKIVLFMTHLSNARKSESIWFIRKVWPRIIKEEPEAKLWIAGTPPEDMISYEATLPSNIEICGYIEDIVKLYESVSVVVVPVLHKSGWINRISDALVAGVPVVTCSGPLSTIPEAKPGEHLLNGNSVNEFANNVLALLKNQELSKELSTNAKKLSRNIKSWEDTVFYIENQILSVLKDLKNDTSKK